MELAIDAVLEAFTWVGLGGGALLALVALILRLIDGTWLPAQAYVDHDGDEVWVRWFDADGAANNLLATGELRAALGTDDTASIWYRYGATPAARLARRHPLLRALLLGAVAFLALGALSAAGALVALALRG